MRTSSKTRSIKNWPQWMKRSETRMFLLGALLVFTLALLFISEPARAKNDLPAQQPAAAMQVQASNTVSSPVTGHVDNRDQTTGLIIGGVLLVLIIIIGTLQTIRKKSED